MRTSLLFPLLLLPLLAACDSNQPKPAAQAPAVTAPTATPATGSAPAPAASTLPVAARPLLGNWAADPATCGTDRATVITATTYAEGGNSCDLTLADNKDGSFKASCGGREFVMTPIFGPSGEGIRISAGNRSQVLYSCGR